MQIEGQQEGVYMDLYVLKEEVFLAINYSMYLLQNLPFLVLSLAYICENSKYTKYDYIKSRR